MDAERDWIGSVTLLLGAFGGAPLPHSGAAILYTYWPLVVHVFFFLPRVALGLSWSYRFSG